MVKDLFDRIKSDKGPLGKWADKAEGYYVFPKLEGPISNRMMFNGKPVVTWSINDYLGLANHPEVLKVDGESAAGGDRDADSHLPVLRFARRDPTPLDTSVTRPPELRPSRLRSLRAIGRGRSSDPTGTLRRPADRGGLTGGGRRLACGWLGSRRGRPRHAEDTRHHRSSGRGPRRALEEEQGHRSHSSCNRGSRVADESARPQCDHRGGKGRNGRPWICCRGQ